MQREPGNDPIPRRNTVGLRINQNIAAMNSYRNLSTTNTQMSKSLEKLSSGFRINRAADDAAGLAISEGLRSQIGGIKVAVRNTQDGISVVQTAEGGLNETQSILQRMRDLAVQAANDGSNDPDSNKALDAESKTLQAELDRIASKTTFNNVNLLDGKYDKNFQVGYAAGDVTKVTIETGAAGSKTGFSSTGLGVSGVDLSIAGVATTGSETGAQKAIKDIDAAIKSVST